MFKKVHSHIGYYISLVVIFVFVFLLVSLFSPNKQMQMAVIMLTALSYCAWGILHHFINHDLHAKIVVEYILIGIVGVTIILFIL